MIISAKEDLLNDVMIEMLIGAKNLLLVSPEEQLLTCSEDKMPMRVGEGRGWSAD